ncbi:MAG: uroporphyrinogen-III C-methyltransferase [Turneriella sp.]|nr:uroporphyrinogen-III C-methyltransferase [Turneriella sp.]
MKGSVTIAGAGPGELEHLTVGALKAIHTADVILYDALIQPSVLNEFPPGAEKIFVGKRCGNHAYTQTMIIAAMIERALQGKRVLRLKGGDPAVFAHLASELTALEALEIPVKILPGVSAMLTAAAELKVPLTTRQTNRHIWITDGHSAELEKHGEAMAVFPGTLIFYMGAGKTAEISEMLLTRGMPGDKPAALIENAGGSQAVKHAGTVADFAAQKLHRSTTGPGIFLIGDALRLRNHSDDDALQAYHAFAP